MGYVGSMGLYWAVGAVWGCMGSRELCGVYGAYGAAWMGLGVVFGVYGAACMGLLHWTAYIGLYGAVWDWLWCLGCVGLHGAACVGLYRAGCGVWGVWGRLHRAAVWDCPYGAVWSCMGLPI